MLFECDRCFRTITVGPGWWPGLWPESHFAPTVLRNIPFFISARSFFTAVFVASTHTRTYIAIAAPGFFVGHRQMYTWKWEEKSCSRKVCLNNVIIFAVCPVPRGSRSFGTGLAESRSRGVPGTRSRRSERARIPRVVKKRPTIFIAHQTYPKNRFNPWCAPYVPPPRLYNGAALHSQHWQRQFESLEFTRNAIARRSRCNFVSHTPLQTTQSMLTMPQ